MKTYLLPLVALLFFVNCSNQPAIQTEIAVVGGGASGVTAALQAARMGQQVTIFEPTEWLGGMLTSAGVSAIDGNHNLPSGIWGEFREHLYDHYGGPEAVFTGWVSRTQFEPSFGNEVFQKMVAAEENITVEYGWYIESVDVQNNKVVGATFTDRNGGHFQFLLMYLLMAPNTVIYSHWPELTIASIWKRMMKPKKKPHRANLCPMFRI